MRRYRPECLLNLQQEHLRNCFLMNNKKTMVKKPSIFYYRLVTVPKVIKYFFIIAASSVLLIELLFKRFPAPSHTFFAAGDIYLKLCYSICAAIIFYFINQHLPRQKRKAKAVVLISNALFMIQLEVYDLIRTVVGELDDKGTEEEKHKLVDEACKKFNPLHPIFNRESAIPFADWYEYINYKAKRIKTHTKDMLLMYDLIEPELMYILSVIQNEVSRSLELERKRYSNTNIEFMSHALWKLYVDCNYVFRCRGKYYFLAEREHHYLFRKHKEAYRYFPEAKK